MGFHIQEYLHNLRPQFKECQNWWLAFRFLLLNMYIYFILIFCLFCSQLAVLFTHFSARCKILFWVDTPCKSLCRSISNWHSGHNLNMGEQLYKIHCLLLCANLILLALSLNWLPPWIFFVYFLICHVMTWVKSKAICIVLYCIGSLHAS